ncbi:hypothetical protein [Pseudochrobactrum sp. XF203]|uniref:hypothetical protein n=1 Tax=Pseudochrobactrum sp. XF203 TaxID=2879116 RepID=UPI001CE325A8|nr:hypothetical protein [Pseudochrobactrum sp. XF203]UCA46891.1 hypothetical protein LDL70_06690 [Pseudochrobactrum sp. XF203]
MNDDMKALEDKPLRGWHVEAIKWLLSEVSAAGVEIPEKFTSDQPSANKACRDLGHELSIAFSLPNIYPELANDSRQKKRQEKLKQLILHLSKAANILNDDLILRGRLSIHLQMNKATDIDIYEIIDQISLLEKKAKDEASYSDKNGFLILDELSGVSQQKMILTQLSDIYENNFKVSRNYLLTRTWENLKGPFIEFIAASYILADWKPLNGAAIYKALDRAGLLKKETSI